MSREEWESAISPEEKEAIVERDVTAKINAERISWKEFESGLREQVAKEIEELYWRTPHEAAAKPKLIELAKVLEIARGLKWPGNVLSAKFTISAGKTTMRARVM